MRNFQIKKEICDLNDSIRIFRFIGSFDADKTAQIGDAFDSSIENGDVSIIIEMDETTFISSPVLGELMGCRSRLIEKGGCLYITGLNAENRNKLKLMGAEKIFSFFPDTASAVRNYNWINEDKGDELKLVIPPNLDYVPELRKLLSNSANIKGYGKRDAFRIETVIDELVNNAVEHGSNGGKTPIEIHCRIFRYKIEFKIINITDASNSTNEVSEIEKRIEGKLPFNLNEKRGRGIELVKILCSEFSVYQENNKTILKVIKTKEV